MLTTPHISKWDQHTSWKLFVQDHLLWKIWTYIVFFLTLEIEEGEKFSYRYRLRNFTTILPNNQRLIQSSKHFFIISVLLGMPTAFDFSTVSLIAIFLNDWKKGNHKEPNQVNYGRCEFDQKFATNDAIVWRCIIVVQNIWNVGPQMLSFLTTWQHHRKRQLNSGK